MSKNQRRGIATKTDQYKTNCNIYLKNIFLGQNMLAFNSEKSKIHQNADIITSDYDKHTRNDMQ